MKTISSKIVCLFVAIFCLVFTTLAQESDSTYKFPTKLTYEKLRITSLDWEEYISSKLEIRPESKSILFTNSKTSNEINLNLNQISLIEEQYGSKALLWGLIGAVGGFGTFVTISNIGNWTDPSSDVSLQTINTTAILCTGAGIAIGALIGSQNKKYRKIFYNGQFIIQ